MAMPITRSGDVCARIRTWRWNSCSIFFKWHLLCSNRGVHIIQRPGSHERFDCENQERKDHHFGNNEESFLPHLLADGERRICRYALFVLALTILLYRRKSNQSKDSCHASQNSWSKTKNNSNTVEQGRLKSTCQCQF